jgi:hypothetical protein
MEPTKGRTRPHKRSPAWMGTVDNDNFKMSIRRKSCDPCFKGRRKCDLAYPVCERCHKYNKNCHYVYPPQLPRDYAANEPDATILLPEVGQKSGEYDAYFQLSQSQVGQSHWLRRRLSLPESLGNLGEISPVVSTPETAWMYNQIRGIPLAFARQAETLFIHKALYHNSFPQPLRAAFGICSACVSLNEANRSVLFQALNAEMSKLLVPVSTSTPSLLESLVTLQAAVLYQIIRLFYGGFEQRVLSERQEYLVRSYGLALLLRAETELQSVPRTWETWILAESIRRTVIIGFKSYTTYRHFVTGLCTEVGALKMLPVSTKPGLWNSRDVYLQHADRNNTTTHGDFVLIWSAAPRIIESFEKFLVVAIKGAEHVEGYIEPLRATEDVCYDAAHCAEPTG